MIRGLLIKILLFFSNPITDSYIMQKWGGYFQMLIKKPNFYKHFFLKNAWICHWRQLNSDIPVTLKLFGMPCFPHGEMGIFISKQSVIGKNCVIFQHVTIGSNTLKGSNVGSPIIGDNCYIGAGAKIIGNIKIGNNCRIGANACVYKDMPDNSLAVCAPTRTIIKDGNLDNHFYTPDGYMYEFESEKWVAVE